MLKKKFVKIKIKPFKCFKHSTFVPLHRAYDSLTSSPFTCVHNDNNSECTFSHKHIGNAPPEDDTKAHSNVHVRAAASPKKNREKVFKTKQNSQNVKEFVLSKNRSIALARSVVHLIFCYH
jgi:hypothetical protein